MDERARLFRRKVPELTAAGATVVREEWYGDVLRYVVMQDPEGDEFCVA
jgi:predicted enzyme related to lactoylglutathione lyase